MLRLCEAEIGGQYRILKMEVPEDTGRRLRALGMTQETSVNVLNRKKNGCLIFKVRGTRLAVGRDIARAIEVEPVGQRKPAVTGRER